MAELHSLSNNFLDYKRGLVKIPSLKERKRVLLSMAECTFSPKIEPKSAKIDEKKQAMKAGRIYRKKDEDRVARMQTDQAELQQKLEREREAKRDHELDGCTFRPQLHRPKRTITTARHNLYDPAHLQKKSAA